MNERIGTPISLTCPRRAILCKHTQGIWLESLKCIPKILPPKEGFYKGLPPPTSGRCKSYMNTSVHNIPSPQEKHCGYTSTHCESYTLDVQIKAPYCCMLSMTCRHSKAANPWIGLCIQFHLFSTMVRICIWWSSMMEVQAFTSSMASQKNCVRSPKVDPSQLVIRNTL